MRPDPADSGLVGISMMRQAKAAGNPYRLLLLDAQMPELDGFGVARQIRADTDLQDAVVMMLSSSDLANDAVRCNELGIARYLVKPVMQSSLLDAILSALGLANQAAAAALATSHPPEGNVLAGRRILVAEDHPVNRKLVAKLLNNRQMIPIMASNGREALRAMKTDAFDLILMDVQMPGMDGLETTRAIREMEKLAGGHIPILAMTAHALTGDRQKCLDAGMDGYITKPLNADELYSAIGGALTRPVRAS